LKQTANTKELYTSQLVFFDLLLFRVMGVKGGNIISNIYEFKINIIIIK